MSKLKHFLFFLSIVYDDSRGKLLRGRKTMLKLCAAQLKEQIASRTTDEKPIWIDLGGGTGNVVSSLTHWRYTALTYSLNKRMEY